MPNRGTVLARFPLLLLERAEGLGLERRVLLREAGLTQEELDDPDGRIHLKKSLTLWRTVLGAIDDPDLGLRLGATIKVQDIGLVGYTMLHSATLGDALRRLTRFSRILDEDYPPRIEISGPHAAYSFEVLPEQKAAMARLSDVDLAAHVAVMRELTGTELVPVEVHFPYAIPPSDLIAHRRFFRAKLRFDEPVHRIILEKKALALPIHAADEDLGRYLDEYAERVLQDLGSPKSLLEKVERAMWAEIKEGRPTVDNVAHALAMSPRTLQRRLREEGTSFAASLDGFRKDMATSLLKDHELAIYEVAFLLGYSEPSTFYRAFRRWTNVSPREFRAANS
jgi:AraC-like DNA-binding protein